MGLDIQGNIHCWGAGTSDFGQEPDYGQSIPPVGTFSSLSLGEYHSCAMDETGMITCWGRDLEGSLDAPLTEMIQFDVGGNHACAVDESDTLYCWGNNEADQTTLDFDGDGDQRLSRLR